MSRPSMSDKRRELRLHYATQYQISIRQLEMRSEDLQQEANRYNELEDMLSGRGGSDSEADEFVTSRLEFFERVCSLFEDAFEWLERARIAGRKEYPPISRPPTIPEDPQVKTVRLVEESAAYFWQFFGRVKDVADGFFDGLLNTCSAKHEIELWEQMAAGHEHARTCIEEIIYSFRRQNSLMEHLIKSRRSGDV